MASTTPTVTSEIPAVLASMHGGSVTVADPHTERPIKATIVRIERTRSGFCIYGTFRPTLRAPLGQLTLHVKDAAYRHDATSIEMYCVNSGRVVILRPKS